MDDIFCQHRKYIMIVSLRGFLPMFAPAGRIGANAESTRHGLQRPLGDLDYFALLNGNQIIDIANAKCKG